MAGSRAADVALAANLLASGGSRLDGMFESDVAAARGGSSAVRLR